MSEEQAVLVRYRLREAKETLEEARLLARQSRWRGALNPRILSPLMWYRLRNASKRLSLSSRKQSDSASSF
jgi:hypothetical protein